MNRDAPPPGTLDAVLNPAQREAVYHGEGPLLVLAGAGSGKTRVLTYRIAHLLRAGRATPSQILAVTFTNKAAGEMRDRLGTLLGPGVARQLWIGTFHAICSRILRASGAPLGLDPRFVIYDEEDQRQCMRQVLLDLGLDERQFPPAGVLAEVSRAKNELLDHVAYAARAETYREEVVARLYAGYERRLRECRALDFDDLLLWAVRLFREHPEVLAEYQERFRYVLVDEYQDTNHAQYVFTSLLAHRHRNLCVVGDDDQAIYKWRGADVRNILEFERDYPDARIVTLDENYRSTQRILAVASAVIRHNPHRHPKALWTANPEGEPVTVYEAYDGYDEARYVADLVRAHVAAGGEAGQVAVLYRTHAQSRQFEEMFLRMGIPYQIVGGLRFYERAEVKDILAYLRVCQNPADEASLRRILNVPRRGIGEATVRRLDLWARAQGVSLWEALGRAAEAGVAPAVRRAIDEFVGIVRELSAYAAEHSARDVLLRALEVTGYRKALQDEGTDEAYARLENLAELVGVAQEVEDRTGDGSLPAFLEHLALQTDVDVLEEKPQRVTLMTLHSAKGLEFPVVVLAGLEEGLFPHARAAETPGGVEEERRLCYVGMTRARTRLVLTYARQRTAYGVARPSLPSRFLAEVPPEAVTRVVSPLTQTGEWPEEEDREVASLQVGDRVRHKTFGTGRVVEIDGEGRRAIVTVRFDQGGTKRLALGYAPLELVGSRPSPS
jgi:DNA helicase-2/ATP-dependent DNA helicase PcrA